MNELRSAYLHAGQIIAAEAPTLVSTILGPCVAVCLWDARRRVGGMNHYMLPHWAGQEEGGRFGNLATARLFEQVLALGSRRQNLVAKVFGGACVIPNLRATSKQDLGAQNIEIARKTLAALAVPIVAEDVGGRRGRKVRFQTDDGAAWVARLGGPAHGD
jgi:chemotaxis protein CheD